jgi:hypothetical protein
MYFAKSPRGRFAANAVFLFVLAVAALLIAVASSAHGAAATTKNNVASFALAGDTYTPTGNKTIVGVKLVNPTVGYDYKLRYQNSSGTVLWQTRVNAVTTSETLSRPLPTDVVKINIDAHGVYWDPGYTTTTAILYQEQ